MLIQVRIDFIQYDLMIAIGIPKMGDPQVTMGFNTKLAKSDLDWSRI